MFIWFFYKSLTRLAYYHSTVTAMPNSTNLLSLLFFFFILISVFLPIGSSLSFNFPSFNESTTTLFDFQNDSFFDKVIQLTKNEAHPLQFSTGRAVYRQPLLLQDFVTGKQADFTTHFSFRITADINFAVCSKYCSGDGLAFFLFPFPFLPKVPDNSSGAYLGLFSRDTALDPSQNQVVAVEFDTYVNTWDPEEYHVGINVNSISSSAYAFCKRSIILGRTSNATISYSSSDKNLSVILMYNSDDDDDPSIVDALTFSHVVDLSEILPNEVAVGFSAATGLSTELHEFLFWDFSSTSLLLASVPAPAPAPSHAHAHAPAPKSDLIYVASPSKNNTTNREHDSKMKLLIGLVSGIGVVMVVSGVVWFIFGRKMTRKHAKKYGNVFIDSDELKEGRGPKRFSFNKLARATNNFAKEGKLGQGGYGNVYKGFLNGEEVAIKRVSESAAQGKKEYISEVKIISRLRHRNLVQLLAGAMTMANSYLLTNSCPTVVLTFISITRVRC